MADLDILRDLARRKDIRSADRASLRTMLEKVDRRVPLSYQERQNLWAYVNRYCGGVTGEQRDRIWSEILEHGGAARPAPP